MDVNKARPKAAPASVAEGRTPRPSPPDISARSRLPVLTALGMGALLWWSLNFPHFGDLPQVIGLTIVGVICLVPALRARVTDWIDSINRASRRSIRLMTVGVFLAGVAYLLITALWQGRDLFPTWHDQQMTLIQTQMLARGRLWMPQHPCADFFETFYVLVKPVYAAMYFPGAALFFVPMVWLHLPYWVLPLLASGALIALLFRIVTEVIDPIAGLLAAAMLVSLVIFRLLSVWVMSHTVFTMLALAAVWCWLKWRKRRSMGWAAGMGAALGWAAITRPIDAVAYAVPLGLAILWELTRQNASKRLGTLAIAFVAALPFLSLQLVFDRGVTGHFLQTPVQYYTQAEFPGVSAYGGVLPSGAHDTSTLLQKQLMAQNFVFPLERQFATQSLGEKLRTRVLTVLTSTLPFSPLIILLPAGAMAVRDPRCLVVCVPLVLFLGGYVLYPFFLSHYAISVAPGIILMILLGATMTIRAWPPFRAPLTLGLLAVSIAALPEFHPDRLDAHSWPTTWFNYEQLPREVIAPALVLYRYVPGVYADGTGNYHDEPVYNVDVAWPDDAPIIRAHDLGPNRDRQIIDYYARIQPERKIYLISRADLKLHLIGKAGDVARRLKEAGTVIAIQP